MPAQGTYILYKQHYIQKRGIHAVLTDTSGGGPYGFSFASNLTISSGFLPRRVDKTCTENINIKK